MLGIKNGRRPQLDNTLQTTVPEPWGATHLCVSNSQFSSCIQASGHVAEYLAVRAHLPAPWQDILDLAYLLRLAQE